MFQAFYRTIWRALALGRSSGSEYEMQAQLAQMRLTPCYTASDVPPPTEFPIKVHPKADEVCAETDEYFYKNWPWRNEAEGKLFLQSETNRWACLAMPNAWDSRVVDSVRVNTLLFLLDDIAERMTFTEGKELYKTLTPIALGKTLPDRNKPLEWITYDIWKSMRATDAELTEVVWQGALLCIMAQVDDARTKCPDIGSLLKHREKEAGIAFVAGVLRFAQRIRLTPAEVSLMSPFFTLYSVHGVTVNDILSYDKEVRLYEETKCEGAFILNMTQAFSNDTGLPQRASKRVLWILIREWEKIWAEKAKELRARGISNALSEYLTGMEYVLGGNEWWSWRTKRYQNKQLVAWAP
ncbi:MAG: hypothetical protein LQ350_001085 [Teloschistes chrysophthalmus]|nr:MAG: hypothetical protein LQ350_001085 [Niorma chrysophthalma]